MPGVSGYIEMRSKNSAHGIVDVSATSQMQRMMNFALLLFICGLSGHHMAINLKVEKGKNSRYDDFFRDFIQFDNFCTLKIRQKVTTLLCLFTF